MMRSLATLAMISSSVALGEFYYLAAPMTMT